MPNSARNTTVQQTALSSNFRRLAPLWYVLGLLLVVAMERNRVFRWKQSSEMTLGHVLCHRL